jgi:glycosyltransferase involved in cell wall biosynthesis
MPRSGSQPIRILQVVQSYFPFQERGGPVQKVRALSRNLVQRGYRVTVLTVDLGFTPEHRRELQIERCPWGWCSEDGGIETIYLRTLFTHRALTVNPHVVGFGGACVRQFDLAHFYGLYDLLGPMTAYFCRRRGVPYVIEPMGMYRPIDRSFRIKRFWHFTLGRTFWRKARRIVATSEMERQELVEDGVPADKLVLRYNGIEAHETAAKRGQFRATHHLPEREPVLLFLGRLIPRKGADILIEAFAEACPQFGRLVIAGPEGEPGYRAQLEKRAAQTGIFPRVVFTGPLYDGEKEAALADADLFVLPSRYENFANAAAEAISFGVPVIVSENCGIRSLVQGRAGLVIPPEKDALCGAIHALLSDPARYNAFKQGCADVAAGLSWGRLAEQQQKSYEQILANHNGAH